MARSEASLRLRNFKNALMSRPAIKQARGCIMNQESYRRSKAKKATASQEVPHFGHQWSDFNDSPYKLDDLPRTGLSPPHISPGNASDNSGPSEVSGLLKVDLAAWDEPVNMETAEERRLAQAKKARERSNPHFKSVLGFDLDNDLNFHRSCVEFLQWIETAHGVQFDDAWIKLRVPPTVGRALNAATAPRPTGIPSSGPSRSI